MTEVILQANIQPEPRQWTKVEINFLLKFYPLYKAHSHKYNASFLRGNLQNRTMAAISKKFWTICGSEHKPKYDINQEHFDFAQDKITCE